MIYVLCLNPAIDCYENIDNISLGKSNRTDIQEFCIGGKGINVVKVLKKYNINPILITILGGFTGKYINEILTNENINTKVFWTDTITRINFKLKSIKEETSFDINQAESKTLIKQIKAYLKSSLSKDDILIVTGNGIGYNEILDGLNTNIVLDVSGKELKTLINYNPILVKPNVDELYEFSNNDNIDQSIDLLLNSGAKEVLCSLGSKGSILKNKEICLFKDIQKGKIITTVGCGDVLLATYIANIYLSKSKEEAFILANAAANNRALKGEF